MQTQPASSSIESQKKLAIDQHSRQADQFADRYKASGCYSSCFQYSRKRLDAWLNRYIPLCGYGLTLLDVGCGTGNHIARYIARGFDASGIDGSANMLGHARAANPSAVLELADVERIPFPDASFDFVLCVEVLRYLPDAAPCIREMARVLTPGGTCLATATPILNLNGYSAINRIASRIAVSDLTKLKQFFTSSRQLRQQFIGAGFQHLTIHGVYLGPVNWIERLSPSLLPGALKWWEPLDARVSDLRFVREFSNMFLVQAIRNL
jgi:ubiquinone/menaquinone biosynthesis C-methylase UbiE